jgi:L-alanine-DL-glutamate epimerase-like enolase superfamily enzyme
MIFSIKELRLELKYAWKISRNTSDYKLNFFVHTLDGKYEGIGEVAPNVRYGESPESIRAGFERFQGAASQENYSLEDFEFLLDSLDLPHALRFGIESAFIHCLSQKRGISVEQLLGIKAPVSVPVSFSLPIMPVGEIAAFYKKHRLERFPFLKVKVNKEEAAGILKAVSAVSSQPLLVDANESWQDPDELLKFLQETPSLKIEMLEQPFPAAETDSYKYLKNRIRIPVFADESITDKADFLELSRQFHGINMKLMKAGGYLNGIFLLKEARKAGLKTMVGCMVETSLGISSAMRLCEGVNYADLDGYLILKEDPFQLLREESGILYPTEQNKK